MILIEATLLGIDGLYIRTILIYKMNYAPNLLDLFQF